MVSSDAIALGRAIGSLAKEQSVIKDNLSGNDASGSQSIFDSSLVVAKDKVAVVKKVYDDCSFIIDHPVQGDVDSPHGDDVTVTGSGTLSEDTSVRLFTIKPLSNIKLYGIYIPSGNTFPTVDIQVDGVWHRIESISGEGYYYFSTPVDLVANTSYDLYGNQNYSIHTNYNYTYFKTYAYSYVTTDNFKIYGVTSSGYIWRGVSKLLISGGYKIDGGYDATQEEELYSTSF